MIPMSPFPQPLCQPAATDPWRTARRGLVAAGALVLAWVALPAAAYVNPLCGDGIRLQPGDTLARVAASCHTTVGALMDANPQILSPQSVRAGDVVWMPGRGAAARLPRPPVSPDLSRPPVVQGEGPCGAFVTVRPGDTFAGIARRCGAGLAALRAANPQIRNVNIIRVGERLRLPAAGSARPPQPDLSEARRVVGTVTGEGIACTAMRGDDGRLYTLSGPGASALRPGDRIEARGRSLEWSDCRQGVTIALREVVHLSPAEAPPRAVTQDVTGTITREGVTCTAMRGDDGRLYTLAGDTDAYFPGDRVRVTGSVAGMSICQQGITLNVHRIRPA